MSILGSIATGLFIGLLGAELFGLASVLAKRLIIRASLILAPEQQERWRDEWLAEFENLNDHGFKLTKLIFAFGVLKAAYKLRVHNEQFEKRQGRAIGYYNSQISSSRTYDRAIYWFNRMHSEKIKPNIATYNALIYASPNYRTALDWHEILLREKIDLVRGTYNTLIKASDSYQTAMWWYRKLYMEFRPNQKTFEWLIDKAVDDNSKLTWLAVMNELNMEISVGSYNKLLRDIQKPESIKSIWDEIKYKNLQNQDQA